jgi:hypothetical protein
MSKGTVTSVDSSTATSEKGSLECVEFPVSPVDGREGNGTWDSERESKEATDVVVLIERRGSSIGGGHSLGGSRGRISF